MGDAPDINAQLLQLKSLIDSSSGTQGKPAPVLVLLPGGGRDVKLANFENPIKDNNICRLPQARPGLIESLKQQLGLKGGQIFDDIKKCGQGVAAMYSGDLPSGSLPGGSMQGTSFASLVGGGPSVGGGDEVGRG